MKLGNFGDCFVGSSDLILFVTFVFDLAIKMFCGGKTQKGRGNFRRLVKEGFFQF